MMQKEMELAKLEDEKSDLHGQLRDFAVSVWYHYTGQEKCIIILIIHVICKLMSSHHLLTQQTYAVCCMQLYVCIHLISTTVPL